MNYSLKGKKVLVTGGTGYIGSHLIPKLLSQGANIRVLIKSCDEENNFSNSKIEYCVGDLTNSNSLINAVKDCHTVIHLAAILGNKFKPLKDYQSANVNGTRILAEAAISNKIERFLHISSIWAYGLVPHSNINESFPLKTSNTPYGDTKMESQRIIEKLYKENNLPVVIIQPGDTYGPNDMKWTIEPMTLMKTGKFNLINNGKGLFQPIYIDDLIDGIMLAIQKGEIGESYILCGKEITTFKEYFSQLAKIMKINKLPSVPYWLAMTMATFAEFFAKLTNSTPPFNKTGIKGTSRQDTYSIKKAQEKLGFEPKTTILEGIKKIALVT